MARHWLVRGTEWLLAGGFDPALPEALEFDLLLRLIDRGGMAGLDAVHEPLLTADAPVLLDNPQEEAALLRHLQGRGYPDAAVHRLQPRRYRIDYRHAARPLVSVLLPVHGATLAQLQRCMETLLEKTGYADYEVLIVAGPAPGAEVQAWLAQIEAWQSPQMRVVRHAQASARAAAVAAALADARGEYVVTVEGATAFVRDDWMQCMLNHAQRPEVAVVGAKLLRPDGTVEHAGLVLGLRGAAGSPFVGEPLDAVGYMHRLEVDQNYSAVSGACMMVRRAVLQEVAGSGLPWTDALHQDVELCLRVRAAGYLVVWTPHAVALHEEMAEAQAPLAMQGEAEAFHAAWLPVLARDPAYNPNLELDGTGFTVDADLSVNWQPLAWHPLPRAVVHPADAFGCGHYRMIQPFQ
ncbi:MAG: glycosyltransferase, partial [Comamonadaceae bacterium]